MRQPPPHRRLPQGRDVLHHELPLDRHRSTGDAWAVGGELMPHGVTRQALMTFEANRLGLGR
ncbi:hypothetical protein [Streptomyces sp. MUSC 14]|uniref:hypothetical protein n=1 Tax=Streptomyces sp. MUSC 14 TaxID=1354889 RepID=UPI0011606DA7|nr:hypothetical protein [Streptomyces sp. MUSC 14]